MSEERVDEAKVNFGDYLVALIDVLGQGEKLESMTSLPQNEEEMAKFISLLKVTFGTVDGLRDAFRGYFEKFRDPERLPGEDAKKLLAQNRPISIYPRDLKLGQFYFSDMFLFYAPICKVEDHLSVQDVYAMLTASAMIMQFSLAGKTAVRGGIDIGIAAEWHPNDLYGNALFKASHLEKRLAQYPRIVVGSQLVRFVEDEASRVGVGFYGMVNVVTARLCQSLIQYDFDGIPFVDFLGPTVHQIAHQIDDGYRDMIQKGMSFVSSEHDRFRKNAINSVSDRKLAWRYGVLRGYYESRIGPWLKK